MSLFWTILLAIAQGLAEFFPVSSSAHLTILGALAGVREEDALVFFLVLHFGTLAATLVFFRKDLWGLLLGALRGDPKAWRFAGLVAVTTAFTGALGFGLKPVTERLLTSPGIAGSVLLFTALYLWCTQYLPKGQKTFDTMRWRDAALVGLAQGLAVIPGVSRSGASISSGLALGLDRESAFRYSFLASLPAIGGAFVLEARQAFSSSNPHLLDDLLGASISFSVGCFALWLWRRSVIRHGPHRWAFWCVIAGLSGIAVATWTR
ncbi:MAG: undecaprenyl-diphosphate phosphatase [Acidobacteriota bacterium]